MTGSSRERQEAETRDSQGELKLSDVVGVELQGGWFVDHGGKRQGR